jgi:hypothetical protein
MVLSQNAPGDINFLVGFVKKMLNTNILLAATL